MKPRQATPTRSAPATPSGTIGYRSSSSARLALLRWPPPAQHSAIANDQRDMPWVAETQAAVQDIARLFFGAGFAGQPDQHLAQLQRPGDALGKIQPQGLRARLQVKPVGVAAGA